MQQLYRAQMLLHYPEPAQKILSSWTTVFSYAKAFQPTLLKQL